jgi:hypothetical protein
VSSSPHFAAFVHVSSCFATDYQEFSNSILDAVFKNKSVLSWEDLDASISHYQLDKVPMVEPLVRRSRITDDCVQINMITMMMIAAFHPWFNFPQEPIRGTWLWTKGLLKSFFQFFWDDNGFLFWSLALVSILIMRFAIAFDAYASKSGVWVGIARGFGADLNILMMLIPLSMMKSTHTRLREIQFILKYFPIDNMIEIHIGLSKLAAGCTLGHVICTYASSFESFPHTVFSRFWHTSSMLRPQLKASIFPVPEPESPASLLLLCSSLFWHLFASKAHTSTYLRLDTSLEALC